MLFLETLASMREGIGIRPLKFHAGDSTGVTVS